MKCKDLFAALRRLGFEPEILPDSEYAAIELEHLRILFNHRTDYDTITFTIPNLVSIRPECREKALDICNEANIKDMTTKTLLIQNTILLSSEHICGTRCMSDDVLEQILSILNMTSIQTMVRLKAAGIIGEDKSEYTDS